MLYPTAGSRLYIADAPTDRNGAISGAWVEIGETEALGGLGVEWAADEAEVSDGCGLNDSFYVETAKRSRRATPMQIILGNVPTDPGQIILWKAAKSELFHPFRLVFPDGGVSRRWLALVVSLVEVFDTANAVMKLQATLIPTHNIIRSEAPS
ncbi:hypothetical protein [Paracoccus alkanivorans]|uniref:Phage tail protein n=1 Tax=Paracoccus alkanivorans TaxID=2116655 RepID=A0A3M0MDE7_9RHOB|nr:hypothetical protein [Paracoccus alkanivorans]RMC35365.1 hypothetical protein C9E81_08975 [Paracoccus alkanivorans]